MSYCTRIQSVIDEADKPDLIPLEATSHLNGCPQCRSFADERTKLQELMALSGRVSVPVNFNVMLNERLSRVKAQKSSWLSPVGFLRLGTATAALAVGVLAVQYSGLISSKPETSAPPQIAGESSSAQSKGLPFQPPTESNPPQSAPLTTEGPRLVNVSGGGSVRVTPRAPRESQGEGRGIAIFIVRDRGREVEVPMIPVSIGMQQQVMNSSGRQQPRSSDISY